MKPPYRVLINLKKYKMTKIETLKREDKRSYQIKVTTKDDIFTIPVVDVRDGKWERNEANAILRNSASRSKHLQPSSGSGGGSYQASPKRLK